MHTTDGDSQNVGNDQTLPESTDPLFLEIEKQRHGDSTSANRNYACRDNEACWVDELVIGSAEVTNIVHAHDRETGKHSGDDIQESTSNVRFQLDFCDIEGKAESDDWQKARQGCVARAVGDLQVILALSEHDGTVADEVHTPDTDKTHGDGAAQQLHTAEMLTDFIARVESLSHLPTRPCLAGPLAVEQLDGEQGASQTGEERYNDDTSGKVPGNDCARVIDRAAGIVGGADGEAVCD